jgi:hypothetical protein
MAATDDATDSNDPCAQFVHSTVSILPSILERLVFLASLHEPDTGGYNDRALEALVGLRFGKDATGSVRCGRLELDRVLRHEHAAVFEEWLCLTMRQRMAELATYASSQSTPPPTLLRKWIDEKSYIGLIPSDAMPVQRQHFLLEMETALAALLLRTFWG